MLLPVPGGPMRRGFSLQIAKSKADQILDLVPLERLKVPRGCDGIFAGLIDPTLLLDT